MLGRGGVEQDRLELVVRQGFAVVPGQGMVAVVAVMAVVGPEEEGMESEADEAEDEDARAGEGAEAPARLVRVSPARRAYPHGLNEGCRLVGHFLWLRREPAHARVSAIEESRWVDVGWASSRLSARRLR